MDKNNMKTPYFYIQIHTCEQIKGQQRSSIQHWQTKGSTVTQHLTRMHGVTFNNPLPSHIRHRILFNSEGIPLTFMLYLPSNYLTPFCNTNYPLALFYSSLHPFLESCRLCTSKLISQSSVTSITFTQVDKKIHTTSDLHEASDNLIEFCVCTIQQKGGNRNNKSAPTPIPQFFSKSKREQNSWCNKIFTKK